MITGWNAVQHYSGKIKLTVIGKEQCNSSLFQQNAEHKNEHIFNLTVWQNKIQLNLSQQYWHLYITVRSLGPTEARVHIISNFIIHWDFSIIWPLSSGPLVSVLKTFDCGMTCTEWESWNGFFFLSNRGQPTQSILSILEYCLLNFWA